ncbi:MAG: BrnT family toxin [Deltaproteobacteria bacterium]|nr:BrnT family toxin [Deltaproteobacteria bacterium]
MKRTGPTKRGLIVVVYTEREEDVIRIIGARLANKNEQSLYRSHMDQTQ